MIAEDESLIEIPSSQEDEIPNIHNISTISRANKSLVTSTTRMMSNSNPNRSVFSSPSIANINKRKSEPLEKTMMKDKLMKMQDSFKQEGNDELFNKLKFGEQKQVSTTPDNSNANRPIDLELVCKLKETNENLRKVVGKLKRTR